MRVVVHDSAIGRGVLVFPSNAPSAGLPGRVFAVGRGQPEEVPTLEAARVGVALFPWDVPALCTTHSVLLIPGQSGHGTESTKKNSGGMFSPCLGEEMITCHGLSCQR